MTEYETLVITAPDLEPSVFTELQKKIEGLCSAEGANLLGVNDWGIKRLAYEIKKQRKGHYMVVNFVSDDNVIPELERNLRYDEKVIRFLTTKRGEVKDFDARLKEFKSLKPKKEVKEDKSSSAKDEGDE